MKIQCLTHVPFEDAGNIQTWADDHKHQLTYTHLYKNQTFPPLADFDALAIMGGPMNIYEYDAFPWLVAEKHFIAQAIQARKKVIGVCLGAQLIADVLGAKIVKNHLPEIGWHPIQLTPQAQNTPLFADVDPSLTVFHWHGDTFSIPDHALHLAASQACTNQAFLYQDHVLALQFHLEYSAQSILAMLENCDDELIDSPYVQNAQQIEQGLSLVPAVQTYLNTILDRFLAL